jgi:hypothetical protein
LGGWLEQTVDQSSMGHARLFGDEILRQARQWQLELGKTIKDVASVG